MKYNEIEMTMYRLGKKLLNGYREADYVTRVRAKHLYLTGWCFVDGVGEEQFRIISAALSRL